MCSPKYTRKYALTFVCSLPQKDSSSTVPFGKTATLACDHKNGRKDSKNYFSKMRENDEVEYVCQTPTSFTDKTGSELQCTLCEVVDGCAVSETCTTASNSKCSDCSRLTSAKGAYRKFASRTDIATVCAKCGGLKCEDNKEVLFWILGNPILSCDLCIYCILVWAYMAFFAFMCTPFF